MKLIDPSLKCYKGNTHTHTTDSDGRVSPEECMRQYKAAGYDFLALTDHWHVGEGQFFQDMLVIPGVEYDFNFPSQVLHLVCLFPDARLAPPVARRETPYDAAIEMVNKAGGAVIAAHPAWSLNTPEFLCSLDGVAMAEVYNTVSGEPFNGPRANSESLLDVAAANGKLFNLVAADDAHFYQGDQCVSYIMVQAEELTAASILQAMKQGRFYASQGPEFQRIERVGEEIIVETSPVSRITVCSERYWIGGRCMQGEGLTERIYRPHPQEKYVRFQLTDEKGKKAWSNPILL